MTNIQELKKPIRAFMQAHYTDERLAQLLCHARDGKLAYYSCCCFIGIPTATHPLEGWSDKPSGDYFDLHYQRAYALPGASAAENAFCRIGHCVRTVGGTDAVRRRILIPMILAEMKQRERMRQLSLATAYEAYRPLLSDTQIVERR